MIKIAHISSTPERNVLSSGSLYLVPFSRDPEIKELPSWEVVIGEAGEGGPTMVLLLNVHCPP